MSFLSLAKGDPAARSLLGNAIKARYGLRPPPISSLDLTLSTPARGPLGLPAVQTVHIQLVASSHWRRDESRTWLGITSGRTTDSYDGGTRYLVAKGKKETTSEAAAVIGTRQQLWAWLAFFLTPLTEEDVLLKSIDSRTLQAKPTVNAEESAVLIFNADYTLAKVEASWTPAAVDHAGRLMLRPAGELRTVNDFAFPDKIGRMWDNAPEQIMSVDRAEANLKIPLAQFSLG